jgi:sortase A
VSDNLSTRLPKPPEIQPLPAASWLWAGLSYALIALGLAMAGWGGWLFYQNQYNLSHPPAPIVAAVAAEPNTPTPQPAASPAATAATPTANRADTLVVLPTVFPTPTVAPSATPVPVAAESLSLADYPLPANPPTPNAVVEAAPSVEEPVEQAPAPLTRMVAESINLDSPVVEVGWKNMIQNGVSTNVWTVADYAAGWHKNSMLPGRGGNIVLSGHHNIKGEVFRYVVDLEPGDIITVYMDNQPYQYAVHDKFIVKDKGEPDEVRLANARWIGPFNDERLTLVTCWPYNNNTHRVIVIAKPV